MTKWLRFEHNGTTGFGALEGETIQVYDGDMFNNPVVNGETLALNDVTLLTPTEPSKMLALWNNFHEMRIKVSGVVPDHPLFFLKSPNSFLATNQEIRRPVGYDGRVVYEGELGIVIGKTCSAISEDEARNAIFGYSCINDVTAGDILKADETFDQWVRSKSFDTFGVYGPVVATGLNPDDLRIKTVLNGDERQNYPVSDMIIPPYRLVSLLSHDVTLFAGDVICCGTSVGLGAMKEPHNIISITIDGVGTLNNTFNN